MAVVQETFSYKPLTASGVLLGSSGGALGGFLCTVAGTVKITEGQSGAGATIVDTLAVTAGTFYPMPFATPTGAYATLAGGAQGTFAVL
jgi:hypothetical protein